MRTSYTMAGAEGPQAARIRKAAKTISDACGIPYEFADERLSSQEAKRSLREKGMTEKAMRGKIDMIAASLFLQAWLDARRELDGRRGSVPCPSTGSKSPILSVRTMQLARLMPGASASSVRTIPAISARRKARLLL